MSLTISEDGEHLFVINSDFDLQFAQGTIQSLDMSRLRELVRQPCSRDMDCDAGMICDDEPTSDNGQAPSFFCVDASDPRPCGDLGTPLLARAFISPQACEKLSDPKLCGEKHEKSSSELSLAPGRCAPIDLGEPPDGGPPLITDVAETSAFATQGLLLSRPCLEGSRFAPCPAESSDDQRVQEGDGPTLPERLFVPVRGDTTVHYLDISDDGRFRCGRDIERSGANYDDAESERLRCSGNYRIDDGTTFGLSDAGELVETSEPPDPDEEEDEKKKDDPQDAFRLPQEPLDLAGSADGRVLVVTHQLGGRASTLINPWTRRPELVHVLTGLEENPIGVAALSAGGNSSFSDFILTYRSDAQVEVLRFADDGLLTAASPGGPTDEQLALGRTVFRPELSLLASGVITSNSVGTDSRGVAVDSTRRDQALAACGDDEICLEEAASVPLDVYVANRTPNSLLVGRTGGSDPETKVSSLPEFHKSVPLTAGPSRVVVGEITNSSGERERRIFVICFDSALIYVFDPESGRIESTIRTGRGPYSMAFDPEQPVAFIGHFTDSHIGAVSLDQRHPLTYGATLATFGTPEPPRAAK